MMIQTEINKNVFGKKKGYIARLGVWQETGKTKKDAKENLKNNIVWFAEQDFNPIVRWSKDGKTCFVLTCTIKGYEYMITDAERKFPCVCVLGQITQKEAIQRMENHANNY